MSVGDVIGHGRYAVTAVKNPGGGVGTIVSAVTDAGEVVFLRWDGDRWAVEDLRDKKQAATVRPRT